MESTQRELTVGVSTWNVNARKPPAPDRQLRHWLHYATTTTSPPDLVAVALQEAADLESVATYLAGPLCAPCPCVPARDAAVAEWADALAHQMPEHHLLGHAQLVGLGLIIFAKPEHARHAKVDFASAGTGPLGLGNKGALVAHVEIYGCWLSLVCCHLAAGSKGPSRRNAEYWSVEERLNLTGVPGQLVVWCGDLNYRIALEADEVRRHAIAGEHGPLLEADELRHAQVTGAAFVAFHEGELTFAPTYKYDVGTSTFDSSKKARAPAWCDRVLWRSDASVEVRSLSYASHELKTSDHRPVSALLHVTLLSAKKAERPEPRQRGILSTLQSVCCLGGFGAKGYHVLPDANLSKRAVADTAASSAPHEQPPEQTLLSPEGTDRMPLLEPREGHARGKPRKKASGRHSKGEAGPQQNSMGSR